MLKKTIPWWNRIKVRLLIFGIIMSVIPLSSLGYFYVKASEEDLLASIQRRNSDLVNHVARDVENLISGIEEKVFSASNSYGVKLLDETMENKEKLLFMLMRDIPAVEDIRLFDATGQEVARVSKREVTNYIKFSRLSKTMVGRNGVVESYLASDGRTMISMAIPFTDLTTQETVGTFLVKVNLRPIIDAISARNGAKEGEIFVVSSNGRLIGHEDFSQVLRKTSVESSLAVQQFLHGKDAPDDVPLRYKSFSGKEVLGVYAPIKKVGWGAIVEIPVQIAYKPISSLSFNLFLATLAVVTIVIGTSIHFALRFTRPIENLERAAEQVGQGELDITLPKTGNDEIGRLVDTFNNMTNQLKQKREMETFIIQTEKMAALGLMSAGVAHEINNPLATVSAYAEDLFERINEEDITQLYQSGELADYLQVIRKQTERGKKITGSLLTFARQPKGSSISININEVIEDTLSLVNYRIRHQGITVIKELETSLPEVKGDLSQLQQVFLNIIGNSLDAMEDNGGSLKVVTEKIHDNVVIKINDSGTGISKEDLEKVFDPFYTTKPIGKGTGLGLSICYGIIKEMNGEIHIESKSGYGTRVEIRLPLSEISF